MPAGPPAFDPKSNSVGPAFFLVGTPAAEEGCYVTPARARLDYRPRLVLAPDPHSVRAADPSAGRFRSRSDPGRARERGPRSPADARVRRLGPHGRPRLQ